jgi:GLPGLI family protein
MKKKYSLLIHSTFTILFLLGGFVFAQKTEGAVSYSRKVYWIKILNRMTYLTQEEKDRDRLTWGKFEDDEQNPPEKLTLFFNANQSLYTWDKEQDNTDGGYVWRRNDMIYQRDFEKETKTELEEMLGKTYLLQDSLYSFKWRILNEIKDVNGYICMKAETTDPAKEQKIVAWFAQDIPVSAGPERFYGLPGLIMEIDINNGECIIEAKKVEFKDTSKDRLLPVKLKGKKLTENERNQLIKKQIFESTQSHNWPYSGIRF